MQKPIKDHYGPLSKAEYALAVAAYREKQERTKSMVQEVLGKYGKPRMTLKQLRATLDAQLGSVSLSQEIIRMRDEGF